jgi:hypothetical protein
MPTKVPPIARFLMIAMTGVSLLGAPIASAQDQSREPPQFSPNREQFDVPDQKLDAAAAALKKVANLKQDFEQRLQSAAPSDEERIVNEARDAIVKAVTDQGLSLDEYTTILVIAQNVPQVREKLLERLSPSEDDDDERL